MKVNYSLFFCACLYCLTAGAQSRNSRVSEAFAPFRFEMEPAPVNTEGYGFTEILDQRRHPELFASLLLSQKGNNLLTRVMVEPETGCIQALSKLLIRGSTYKGPVSILIKLKDCTILESAGSSGNIQGKMSFVVEFDRVLFSDTLVLTTYNSTGGYFRSPGDETGIEPAFHKMVLDALFSFNGWMKARAMTNPKLASSVLLEYVNAGSVEPDTLAYSADRPLEWSDFREAPPQRSKFGAQIFPLFSFSEHVHTVKGIIRVRLTIRAAIARSNCWVKNESRDAWALNHEQRHFDILEITRLRFIAELRKHAWSVTNFDGEINAVWLNAYHDLGAEEDLYDDQAVHGLNRAEQEKWNRKIDQELLDARKG